MTKRRYKYRFLSIIFILIVIFSSVIVHAEGDGTGGGAGPDGSFVLRECSIYDGMTDVPISGTIALRFSKNVADITVRDYNMSCISISAVNGSYVDYYIRCSDLFEERRFLNIDYNLEYGTTYTLYISDQIMARNGESYLAQPYSFTFTTVEDPNPVEPEDPIPPSPGDGDADGSGSGQEGDGTGSGGDAQGHGSDSEDSNAGNSDNVTPDIPQQNEYPQEEPKIEEPEVENPEVEETEAEEELKNMLVKNDKDDPLKEHEKQYKDKINTDKKWKVYSVEEVIANGSDDENKIAGKEGRRGTYDISLLKILLIIISLLLFVGGGISEAVYFLKRKDNVRGKKDE